MQKDCYIALSLLFNLKMFLILAITQKNSLTSYVCVTNFLSSHIVETRFVEF